MEKYFLFDCETGGIESKMSLLTLYGHILDSDFNIVDTIDLTMKPDNGIYLVSAEAMMINKINLIEHDRMAITITEASKQFHNFVFKHANQQKLIPAGHNVSFDIDAIKHHLLVNNSDFSKHSWERYFSHRMIDTAVIANFLKLAKKIPKNVNNLENLASHYGIIIKDGQIHNAKTDVQISLEVLKRQIHCVQ